MNGYSEILGQDQFESVAMQHVAQEYELSPEQTKLLVAIRKAESGGPGREFGILNKEAMRFKDNPGRSSESEERSYRTKQELVTQCNLYNGRMRWQEL